MAINFSKPVSMKGLKVCTKSLDLVGGLIIPVQVCFTVVEIPALVRVLAKVQVLDQEHSGWHFGIAWVGTLGASNGSATL